MADPEPLDREREKRGIRTTHFSEVVGFSSRDGWGWAVKTGYLSREKAIRAMWALGYYDERGYLPEPSEVPHND